MPKEAQYYKIKNNKVQCRLCPHNCNIEEDDVGICGVRKNFKGKLIAENYEIISGLGFDPIEKKPLYHFYPGKTIFSIGSFGCNLKCSFCQNCDISQTTIEKYHSKHHRKKKDLIDSANTDRNNIGIAFTYNEPTVFYEFMYDTALIAKENNMKTVMVSNGFINSEPLKDLFPFMDAFNIDLKAFSDFFYKKLTKSSLKPVLETLIAIKKADKHLEITNLVIPGQNDDQNEFHLMIKWIKENLGNDTVLHISRYFPRYKLDIAATPQQTLMNFYQIAKEYLFHVYLGNVQLNEGRDTHCPNCNEFLISRSGYFTEIIGLTEKGNCIKCNTQVIKHI